MQGTTTKRPRDWIEADILDLIEHGVKEGIGLDYKRSAALQKTDRKKDDVSIAVSAFANADGGTIVYGVQEDKHVPTVIDDGFDPLDVSKEWLDSVVNSTIRPRIDGVRINQVELPTTRPGRVLYVVEVPKAVAGGPHQASDKRYYKRFNFESVRMEDYEIRDVMRRAEAPDLYCAVTAERGDADSVLAFLNLTIGNRSAAPALYAHIDIFIDGALSLMDPYPFVPMDEPVQMDVRGALHDMHHLTLSWIVPDMLPIWQGHDQRVGRRPLPLGHSPHVMGKPRYFIVVTINSPHMASRTTIFELRIGDGSTWVHELDPLT